MHAAHGTYVLVLIAMTVLNGFNIGLRICLQTRELGLRCASVATIWSWTMVFEGQAITGGQRQSTTKALRSKIRLLHVSMSAGQAQSLASNAPCRRPLQDSPVPSAKLPGKAAVTIHGTTESRGGM